MKRVISLFLCFVLLFSNLPFAYAAAETEEESSDLQVQLAEEEASDIPVLPEEDEVTEAQALPEEEEPEQAPGEDELLPEEPQGLAPEEADEENPEETEEESQDSVLDADGSGRPDWESDPEIAEITTHTQENAGPVMLLGVYDSDYPYIEDFELAEAGQTLKVGDTVHFRVKFHDDDGIRSAELSFGSQFNGGRHWRNLEKDSSAEEGWMVGEYTFTENDAAGEYLVLSASATDTYGYRTSYSAQSRRVAQRLFPGTVRLENPSGVKSDISNLVLDQAGQTVRPGDEVTFSFEIPAGLNPYYISAWFSGTGGGFGLTYSKYNTDNDLQYDAQTGKVTGSISVSGDTVNGKYYLSSISVDCDSANIYQDYRMLSTNSFTVAGGADAPEPTRRDRLQVTDFTCDENGKTLTDGETVHFRFHVSSTEENLEGYLNLQPFQADEYNESGVHHSKDVSISVPVKYNPVTKCCEAEYTFQKTDLYSVYIVSSLDIGGPNAGYSNYWRHDCDFLDVMVNFAENKSAAIQRLGTASNLRWGADGTVYFKVPDNHQSNINIAWYRAGGENVTRITYVDVVEADHFDTHGVRHFTTMENLTSGKYYFTVQLEGDGIQYYDGTIAKSPEFTYTVPSKQVGNATDLKWDAQPTDGRPAGSFVYPNDPQADDAEIEFYYSATENGTPEPTGHFTGAYWETVNGRKIGKFSIWNKLLQTFGTGYYYFTVRIHSNDIFKARPGEVSELSPSYHVTSFTADAEGTGDKLQKIDTTEMTPQEIRDEVQKIPTGDLETAMLSDDSVVETLRTLEAATGISTEVSVDPAISMFSNTNVSIVGAALNETESTGPITLNIGQPKQDDVVPTMFDSTIAVRFSMDLDNVTDTENLKVPVLLDIPVPQGINPSYMVILHYHANGTDFDVIHPFLYEVQGRTYAQFTLTSFSDFVITETVRYREVNEYLLMQVGQTQAISLPEAEPWMWEFTTNWYVADTNHEPMEDAPISVDENGNVTALKPGAALVCRDITDYGYTQTEFCVVEVVSDEKPIASAVTGVTMSAASAVTELYSRNFTRLYVNLDRPEAPSAYSAAATLSVLPQEDVADGGCSITAARFADPSVNALFHLAVVDDNTLEIIPTDAALQQAAKVKSRYQSGIVVTIGNTDFTVQTLKGTNLVLTLTVKKSVPKITVKPLVFNSLMENSVVYPWVTGGEIVSVSPDEAAAAKKKVPAVPDWMGIDEEQLCAYLKNNAPKTASGKLYLTAQVAGWNVEVPLVVSYSIKAVQPKVTFAPKSLTLNSIGGDYGTVDVRVTPEEFFYYSSPTFVNITEGSGKSLKTYENGEVLDVSVYGSDFFTVRPLISDGKSHTYTINLSVGGKQFGYKVNVKAMPVTMSVKKSGTIDTGIPGSYVEAVLTPKNFNNAESLGYTVTRIEQYDKKTKATVDVKDRFEKLDNSNPLRFRLKKGEKLKAGCTYQAYISASTSNGEAIPEVKVPLAVKWTAPEKVKVSASLKMKYGIDVSICSHVEITPTLKNCFIDPVADGNLTVFENGVDVTSKFRIYQQEKSFIMFLEDGEALNPKAKYTVQYSASYVNGNGELCEVKSTAKLTVSMSKVNVTVVSQNPVHLNGKNRFDQTTFQLSTTVKQSDETPLIEHITLDAASEKLFDVIQIGINKFALKYKDDVIAAGIVPGKAVTVKVQVFLEGNGSATPNGTQNLKVNIV